MIQAVNDHPETNFREAEIEYLGASHEAFGEGLCRAWKFPRCLQLSTGYHHRPWELHASDQYLPSLIHVADILAKRAELGYGRTVETDEIDTQLLHRLDLSELDVDRILERLPDETFESHQLMADA